MKNHSPFINGCKKKLRRQAWIINIHQEEHITVDCAIGYMNSLRESNILTFKVTLSKRVTTQKTNYEELRSRFNSIHPIVSKASAPVDVVSDMNETFVHLSPAAKFAVYSLTKSTAPKDWKELAASDHRKYWVKVIYGRFVFQREG